MIPNLPVLAATALIPFLIAYIWFHPKVFGGDTWNTLAGLSTKQSNKKVKPVKLLLSIALNFFIAFGLYNLAVHQSGVFGLVSGNVDALKTGTAAAFLSEFGANHLTFGHGMVHGVIPGVLCFVLPILGYATIFERKDTKYLLVNLGFWTISLMLMGGVISKWGATPV